MIGRPPVIQLFKTTYNWDWETELSPNWTLFPTCMEDGKVWKVQRHCTQVESKETQQGTRPKLLLISGSFLHCRLLQWPQDMHTALYSQTLSPSWHFTAIQRHSAQTSCLPHEHKASWQVFRCDSKCLVKWKNNIPKFKLYWWKASMVHNDTITVGFQDHSSKQRISIPSRL